MSAAFKTLYSKYREVPLDTWKKQNTEQLAKALAHIYPNSKGDKSEGTVFVLAAKVAHAATEQEFCEFMETGDIPPMKLNNEEMTALRGGGAIRIKGFNSLSVEKQKEVMALIDGSIAGGGGMNRKDWTDKEGKSRSVIKISDSSEDIGALNTKLDTLLQGTGASAIANRERKRRG